MPSKEDGRNGKKSGCKMVGKFFNNEGGNMKCSGLISRGKVSSCTVLDKPYVPSLFELVEYCKTIDHRKCPFYLKGIICMDQAESNTRRAFLSRIRKGRRINAVDRRHVGQCSNNRQ
jgi:hypothetical protein